MPPRATDHKVDWRIEARPIGQVNWTGMWTLYLREVRRFFKMLLQAVLAPIVTCLLFLAIFTIAFGDGRGVAGLDYGTFLAPGLIMMSVIQQSFANCSSSLISAKIVGNIVDTMMAPLGPGELLVAYALSGVTRGLIVALGAGGALALFVDFPPIAWGWATYFVLMSALTMALAGIVAGLWSEKFDHLSTVTNFVITPLAFLSGTFYSVELAWDVAGTGDGQSVVSHDRRFSPRADRLVRQRALGGRPGDRGERTCHWRVVLSFAANRL